MTSSEYYLHRLQEIGITPDSALNHFTWSEKPDAPIEDLKIFPRLTHPYFAEHPQGIEICTPDLKGMRPHHIVRSKPQWISRLRLMHAADENKYKFLPAFFSADKGANYRGSWAFLPPRIVELYETAAKVRTLYITEGEFKAFAGAMHGLPIIGVPGIHNLRQGAKGRLNEQITAFINQCRVEVVVMLYDSDMLSLSDKIGKNSKDADYRPRSFMKSADAVRKLLVNMGVNVVIGKIADHPGILERGLANDPRSDYAMQVPRAKKYGLDDLLTTRPGDNPESWQTRARYICGQLDLAADDAVAKVEEPNAYFELWDITEAKFWDKSASKSRDILSQIFKLDSVEHFYEYHIEALKGFESFGFKGRNYLVKDGVLEMDIAAQKYTGGFHSEGNSIYRRDQSQDAADGPGRKVSDFNLTFTHNIEVSGEESWRFGQARNEYGQTYHIRFDNVSLSSLSAFRKILNRYTALNWMGNEKDYIEWKAQYDASQQIQHSKLIDRYGWDPDREVFIFTNGVVDIDGRFYPADEFGIVNINDSESICIGPASKIRQISEQSEGDRWLSYHERSDDNQLTVSDWFRKMQEVYDLNRNLNGTIGAAFSIMSVFADIVQEATDAVPLIYLVGIPQSGKSQMAQSITSLFGGKQQPIFLDNTTVSGMNRAASRMKNVPLRLDEYSNSLPKYIIDLLKNAWDRAGRTTAKTSNDSQIIRVHFHSTFVLSGQQTPGQGAADNALYSRGMICNFQKSDFSAEQKDRKWELEELEDQGLSYIIGDLMAFRSKVDAQFAKRYKGLQREIQVVLPDVPTRMVQNYCSLLAVVLILQEEGALDTGLTEAQWLDLVVIRLRAQGMEHNETNEVATFWDIFETLYFIGTDRSNHLDAIYHNTHFQVKDGFLYLDLHGMYDIYLRYAIHNNRRSLDEKTIRTYLMAPDTAFVEVLSSKLIGRKKVRAMVFDAAKMREARNVIDDVLEKEGQRLPISVAPPPPLPVGAHMPKQLTIDKAPF